MSFVKARLIHPVDPNATWKIGKLPIIIVKFKQICDN
jgi:hypothetical protein